MKVYVVDAVRTPFCRRNDALREWHPVDLSAELLKVLAARIPFDGNDAVHLYLGCAMPIGEQAGNIAHAAVLSAGWDYRAVATTIDGGVVAGHLAIHAAVNAIASGTVEFCVAGGVESTSRIPLGATTGPGLGKPFGSAVHDRYANRGGLRQPGVVAEQMARRHGLDRTALDSYAERSILQAAEAIAADTLKAELISLRNENERGQVRSAVEGDSQPHIDVSSYKAAFATDGLVTAGTFAAPADGACAVALASDQWCQRQGVTPLARIRSIASLGVDPLDGSVGDDVAIAATTRATLSIDDIDAVELHEDSAATPLGFSALTGIPLDAINVHGGALAFGEPRGASGAQVLGHLARLIASDTARRGLAIVSGWSPIAAATVLERP